jgi:riboflavin kinase/FMN adenylyltransferase
VLTIGNFDGVHRGHRAVLTQLAGIARDCGEPAVLMTFEPQPQEFFAPHQAPARLTRLREKLKAFSDLPLARVCCLDFDWSLATLSPMDFIEDLLVKKLGIRHVVVGDDFRFGRDRQGDLALLHSAGQRLGFAVSRMETCRLGNERVSSTRIRHALLQGELEVASELLGRRYSLCGRIIHGDQRGRSLGFPTANIALHRRILPLSGVFAVQVLGVAEQTLPGIANVGFRPTVDGKKSLLEVHLLDFEGNLYGRHVRVEFLHKLREEQRFSSLEALRQQIQQDVQKVREYFSGRQSSTLSVCSTSF